MKVFFLKTAALCWLVLVGIAPLTAQDKNFKGYRFFINPGHGGHDSDDRNIAATGFWESEGNLEKGLYLKYLLENERATVFISRTTNTSADDLDFAVIDEMANAANVDFFLSIHSNGGSGKINRPLTLYRGYDNQPVFNSAKVIAGILWQKFYENGNCWTHTDFYSKGDWSFYLDWGKQGLGVLRQLAVPGVLSEGSFHDYLPESWRMRNTDFLHHEAWAIFRTFKEYYGITKPSNGIAAGVIRDANKKSTWKTTKNSLDAYQPLNGAIVTLRPGNRSYQVDNQKNGFYYFDNLEPGNYTLYVEGPNEKGKDSTNIVVKTDKTTLTDFKLDLKH
jgi:N-acetylmuramoyl-L-alanine amidase